MFLNILFWSSAYLKYFHVPLFYPLSFCNVTNNYVFINIVGFGGVFINSYYFIDGVDGC